jgi:hypothetical protein
MNKTVLVAAPREYGHRFLDNLFRAATVAFEVQLAGMDDKIDTAVIFPRHTIENFSPDFAIPVDFIDRYHFTTSVWLILYLRLSNSVPPLQGQPNALKYNCFCNIFIILRTIHNNTTL